MQSNITITDELVAEIADRMADEGQKVSPVAIWNEVHTGSVVAVSAALRKWRETRAPRVPQVVERPALPEAVADTMRGALDQLWTSAQDEAERAVARRLTTMRQRVEDASAERDDALAELQTTVQELDSLQVQLDQMSVAYDQKVDAMAGLAEDIALAVQRADAAEKRAQELAERVSQLEAELERALSELNAQREASAHEATGAEAAETVASESVEGVADTQDSEAERAALEAAHAEAVARLEGELEAIRAKLQEEQDAHAARREEAAGAQAERDAAALELQNAQAQITTLTDERNADASEIARLSASLSEAQERADAEQQRAAALAENSAASEPVESAKPAPATVDSEELETLKAQIARDAQAHAAAIAEARETVQKWSEYSNALKQQLTQANEKMMVVMARGAGEATLSRRLSAELGLVKPEHELLQKAAQQQVIVETINAHLEKLGYSYDEKTGAVSKLNAETAVA
ncbi:DNA-binding protein [Paraburkholderia sp. MMS20-SJTR3]|uniref:DNA-binding protein n=1 Tax=Paraburkholderia sejongensis TaxID=2886946 RepID=A0ABS8K2J5_9BURK|nr:DNA-binding protein [Paraburkholderia sp. MMS20-SJTR3]MCC8396382.1 DNA-binding protein [Paraburkholderia sp. MMS20-SJTR3]